MKKENIKALTGFVDYRRSRSENIEPDERAKLLIVTEEMFRREK